MGINIIENVSFEIYVTHSKQKINTIASSRMYSIRWSTIYHLKISFRDLTPDRRYDISNIFKLLKITLYLSRYPHIFEAVNISVFHLQLLVFLFYLLFCFYCYCFNNETSSQFVPIFSLWNGLVFSDSINQNIMLTFWHLSPINTYFVIHK